MTGASLLVACSSARAAVYYVSPAGDDTAAGDATAPWHTVNKAAMTAAAGDTVYLMSGIYPETLMPAHSGTGEATRITFAAAPGQDVTLDGGTGRLTGWTLESGTPGVDAIYSLPYKDRLFGLFQDDFATAGRAVVMWDMGTFNLYGSNPNYELHLFDPTHDYYNDVGLPMHDGFSQYKYADGVLRARTWDAQSPDNHVVWGAALRTGMILDGRSYITIQGLKFRNYRNFATLAGSTHILIDQCDFRYSGWTGMWLSGADGTQIRRSVIQGCGSWIGHYEDDLNIQNSNFVTLEDNDISYGGHGNLVVLGCDHFVLRGNTLHDSGGHLFILKQWITAALIENNTFARAPTTAATSVHRVPHAAIEFNGGMNCLFRRNLIYASGLGLMVSADTGSITDGNEFANNTISGNETDGIQLLAYPDVLFPQLTGNDFVNNIICNSGGYEVHLDIPGGDAMNFFNNPFRSNLIYGPRPLRLWTLNRTVLGGEMFFPDVFFGNLALNPLFEDPANGKFTLQPGSPAIDAGLDVGLPFLGAAPDLGAFEKR